MTRAKKEILPALHDSGKVTQPDLQQLGNTNYTSTILRYANLAVRFPQLKTDAKTIVDAINEIRVIPNPEIPTDDSYVITSQDGYTIVSQDDYIITSQGVPVYTPDLNYIQIKDTIYKIAGGDPYVLPIASDSTLGGIKVGSGLTINSTTGVLSTSTTLEGLTDVDVDNPTTGQTLVYNEETDKWENKDGGGDYSAGAGIYFTNGSVINAEAGRISPLYYTVNFSREWGQSGEYQQPCWEDTGTTVDEHIVYQSFGGTYQCPQGDSLCSFYVEGYDDVTFYIKQDAEDTDIAYVVLGDGYNPIDLENRVYAHSYKGETLTDFESYHFNYLSGVPRTFEVLYHVDPSPSTGTATVDLNNGQWADSGQIVDGHTVYMSDAGSWHINNGSSVCTINFSGVTSFTIYCKPSSERNYDFVYVGELDQSVSTSNYRQRFSGSSDYTALDYTCSDESHTLQILYKKDSSVNDNDDRGYFYIVINGELNYSRGYVYIVPGQIHDTSLGEIFNNYSSNYATGLYSHSEGSSNRAYGYASHAEGGNNIAQSSYSHAEGDSTQATGSSSHTEGFNTRATAEHSHAEGHWTQARGAFSHAEGYETVASGDTAHAENRSTIASGENSHAEGRETQATAQRAHAEGGFTLASASAAHAEGYRSVASGEDSHAEGYYATASGFISHAEGYETTAGGSQSHAEGTHTTTSSYSSHAEGYYTSTSGEGAHAEGYGESSDVNIASGKGSHVEGGLTKATGNYAHAEGFSNIASGLGAHAEGYGSFGGQNNTASGISAHAEGSGNVVSGNCGHAEGTRNIVYGESGHADGSGNQVYGRESHASGSGNTVSEHSGYVEGAGNKNIAYGAHVEGLGNSTTYKAMGSHTEGAGNRNYGHQSHIEGAGNTLSGEETHVEGAGNQIHGPKIHAEGGGNIAYGLGSHIEGKHNVAVGFSQHAEGTDNTIGVTAAPAIFSYGTTYAIGDIVAINDVYRDTYYPEDTVPLLFRCVTAPGQIQATSNIQIVEATVWNSSTTYPAGSVVRVSGIGLFTNSSENTGKNPAVTGNGWSRISSILSPFKSYSTYYKEYCLLDCDSDTGGSNKVAIVEANSTITPMWEPVATPQSSHVEGIGNVAIGSYQHVGGKYNTADADKALIIGNGTADAGTGDIIRSNALTVDWSGNLDVAGDVGTGVALGTLAQTLGAAINEIVDEIPSVSVTQIQSTGTKIATVTIDSTSTDLYAPTGSGSSTLAGLSDVTITSATSGQVLTYNGSDWENAAVPSGSSTLAGLTDVSLTTPTNGQVLKYDSTSGEWVNANETIPATPSLDNLTNVSITTPSNGQVLTYDSSSQEWINSSVSTPDAEDVAFDDTNVEFEADNVQDAFENITKTLTWAEYQALTDVEKNNGTIYFISDINGDGQNFQPIIRSLEEREIGVWTDGKPLYEKTVYNAGGTAGTINIAHNITNFGHCVNAFGTAYDIGYREGSQRIGAGDLPFPRIASDHNNIGIVGVNDTYANLNVPNAFQDRVTDIYITLQYTKSTDTSGSGTWTPQGVPAVHYSTDEKVVGTWIDGSIIYEKTIILNNGNDIEVSNTGWTNTGVTFAGVQSVLGCFGVGSNGAYQGDMLAYSNNSILHLQTPRNGLTEWVAVVAIRYTKSSS